MKLSVVAMLTRRIRSCAIILATILAMPNLISAQVANGQDVICGPRCVHHILESYRKSEDLMGMVEEIQGPLLEREVSLGDLARALERRHIHCKFVSLGPLEFPSWPYPILLHVNGNHFVVMQADGGAVVRVWDGLLGESEVGWWELKGKSSNALLLTSDHPIGQESYSVQRYRYLAISLGLLFALGGGYALLRIFRHTPGYGSRALAQAVACRTLEKHISLAYHNLQQEYQK
jgi:hypothetical protein